MFDGRQRPSDDTVRIYSYLQLHHFQSGISSGIAPMNFSDEFLLPPYVSYPQPPFNATQDVETGFCISPFGQFPEPRPTIFILPTGN